MTKTTTDLTYIFMTLPMANHRKMTWKFENSTHNIQLPTKQQRFFCCIIKIAFYYSAHKAASFCVFYLLPGIAYCRQPIAKQQ